MVRDPTIPPTTLLNYGVIITSYAFVMSQCRKTLKFVHSVDDVKKKCGLIPERPDVSIFSEIFYWHDGVKSPYLILDDVNAVKNARSLPFEAVFELRCLMLPGSPIDNTCRIRCALHHEVYPATPYSVGILVRRKLLAVDCPAVSFQPDVFAFLQFLQGHPIRSKKKMLHLLSTPNRNTKGGPSHQQGNGFCALSRS